MTDEFLMHCVKNEDLDKAAILYERYKRKLYHFFLHKNNNDKESSEDCVQQVFYRMIKYRKSYKDESNFSIWIYGIAKNIQYQGFRELKKMNEAQATFEADEGYISINDDHRAIQQALSMLPEPFREVIVMSKFMGLKYEEIAEINNCTAGVIKTRVFRAMKSLREVYFKII